MFRMNGTPRAQDAHDCRDAGGRATQEQLPRSGASQICTAFDAGSTRTACVSIAQSLFYLHGRQGGVVGDFSTVVSEILLRRRLKLGWDCIYQNPLTIDILHSRGCAVPYFRTVSDMDVATEPPWMGSRRVLKKGTARPWRPCRLRVNLQLRFVSFRYDEKTHPPPHARAASLKQQTWVHRPRPYGRTQLRSALCQPYR